MVELMRRTSITIPQWEQMGPAVIATALRQEFGVGMDLPNGIDPNRDEDW